MKMQKKLNIILVILLVVLVSLISFGGIYYKNKNVMNNRIPSYILGADLTGYRRVIVSPSETTNSTTDENSTEGNNTAVSDENATDSQSNSVVDSNNTIIWLPGLKKSKFDKAFNENYDIILWYN